MLSPEEKERYRPHLMMPGFSEERQEKLKGARVLVVGLNGIGVTAAAYLALAGVGTLILADDLVIEPSDLVDGVFYVRQDVSMKRVDCIASRLKELNPFVGVLAHPLGVADDQFPPLLEAVDRVVCCVQRNEPRLVLNELCLSRGIPVTYSYVHSLSARVLSVVPGKTGCLNCLVDLSFPEYRRVPVMGVGSAVAGLIQASETIKSITGFGYARVGELILVDLNSTEMFTMKFERDPNCKTCGGMDFGQTGEKGGSDKA